MGLNINNHPLLYSASTVLASKVAKRYYNNIHFVWCTTSFNSDKQPPTSNPATICKRYLEQAVRGDRHANEITTNIAGILRGAKAKLANGIISRSEYNDIRRIVSVAEYKDFLPVLYIIESRKVKDRCIDVPLIDRASDFSVEYKIEDLKEDEFQLISFSDILGDTIHVIDKKVGS